MLLYKFNKICDGELVGLFFSLDVVVKSNNGRRAWSMMSGVPAAGGGKDESKKDGKFMWWRVHVV